LLHADHDIRLRLAELTTLNKTSTAVVSTLDTQQVINTILSEVQGLLQVRQCALLVMNETTRQLEVWASHALSQNYLTGLDSINDTDSLPAYRAVISKQPVQVPNIETEADFTALLPLARAEGYRSLLAIPLMAPHVPPAVLIIYRADVHHFSQQEIDLAASFANHAAIALEHATLFSLTDAELQQQVRFLSTLNQVARTANQSLVVEEVLNNALNAVQAVTEVEACWIYLQRETETFLRLRAQRGFSANLVEQLEVHRVGLGQGLIGQVAQTGQPLLLNAAQLHHVDFTDDPLVNHGHWQSLALAPLLAKGTTIGVLGMASQRDRAFTQAQAELLRAIGDQIAMAVVNARLYRRSREVATLEERNRVAREIHDTLAQGFTGILLQLQAAERLSLKHPEKARQSLQEAHQLARESLQEARRSVLNLRPTVLETLPLVEVMALQMRRFEAEHHLKADFILEGYPYPLQAETEQNLYRITQEALTNASRHARANHVIVTLYFAPQAVTLTITDDGIGLNGNIPNSAHPDNSSAKSGFGLVGIQERVRLMQGRVTFETPGLHGTQIKVVIPP
jgi:signal transduction histidine kinase